MELTFYNEKESSSLMIITKKFAEEITKEKLAELATRYANGFAQKLGAERRIKIPPDEVVYDCCDAEHVLLTRLELRMQWQDQRQPDLKAVYDDIKKRIRQREGFVYTGVAYIPITALAEEDREILSELAQDTAAGFVQRLIGSFKDKRRQYFSIPSFASEVAHLATPKLYGAKCDGLDETMDIFSQLYEITFVLRELVGSSKKNRPPLVKD